MQRSLLERVVRMFSTGDASAAEDVFSAEYLDHQGLGEGPLTGPAGFRRVVQVARGAFTKLDVRIEDVLIDDDKVAARLRWSGIRDGRSIERETIDILRVDRGMIVEHWGARLWASER